MKHTFKTLVVRNPFVDNLERFRSLARQCVESGVTHLTFTEIERSLWEVDDPWDPYLNWAMVHTSVFKIFPPELLADWVPADYAARALDSIAAKAAILKETGLKGAAFLYDPMYWPERVFRIRPDLRGPRVDAPNQCIVPRFAPCVDQAEVLAMYQEAFSQLYQLSDGMLDLVILRTNDSATGFCWSNLYNGLNGPGGCRHIDTTTRVNRFLQACGSGIGEVGGHCNFYLGGGSIAGTERKAFADSLPQNCGYYSHNTANAGGERILSGFSTNFSLYPLFGIPNTWEIIDRLAMAAERRWPHLVMFTCPSIFGNDWNGDPEPVGVMRHFQRQPALRFKQKMDLATTLAAELYGEEAADAMVESWLHINRAASILNKSTIGMADLIFYGAMAQRWLTRPLVVYPERLTDTEKAHYLPYLFQARPGHENPDMLDQSNARQFDGLRHYAYFNRHFVEARSLYRQAAACVREADESSGKQYPELAARLNAFKIMDCILHSINHWIHFNLLLEALQSRQLMPEPGAVSFFPFNKNDKVALDTLIRAEADNSLLLADLVEAHPEQMEHSATVEQQGPFMFGPELAADLRRKAEIMFDHMHETSTAPSSPSDFGQAKVENKQPVYQSSCFCRNPATMPFY